MEHGCCPTCKSLKRRSRLRRHYSLPRGFGHACSKRQQRKREQSTSDQRTSSSVPENDNPAIYPLAIPLLAGPAAIMSVIVVNASFAGALTSTIIGYASLIAVMVATGLILCMTVIAESWLNERVTMVFSRITAIILAGLSVQYVIDGINLSVFFREDSSLIRQPFSSINCRILGLGK